MAGSTVQLPADGTGKHLRTNNRGGTTGHDQYVIPTDERLITFRGKAETFAIAGIAGTAGHKLATIHNATASPILVGVKRIVADLMLTAARVVEPAKLRVHRITVLPTGGTAIPKVPIDTAETSNAALTILGAASADAGTASAITATVPASNILTQEWAPRGLTLVGYEQFDRAELLEATEDIVLRPLQGLCVELVYTVATASPTTDRWLVGFEWVEYTVP